MSTTRGAPARSTPGPDPKGYRQPSGIPDPGWIEWFGCLFLHGVMAFAVGIILPPGPLNWLAVTGVVALGLLR